MAALKYLETTKEIQPLEQEVLVSLSHDNSKAPGHRDVSYNCMTAEVVVHPPHQQRWQQNNCFKGKEKVIVSFYLQHHLRALGMFLTP